MVFFFLTILLPWKLSPLCGVFTEALEVDSNPESVNFLNRGFFLKKNKQCLENRKTKVFDRRWKNAVKLLWRCPCLGREAAKPVTTVDYEVFVEYGS